MLHGSGEHFDGEGIRDPSPAMTRRTQPWPRIICASFCPRRNSGR